MKRPSKPVDTCGECEIWVAKVTSNKMSGVCRNVAALVVSMEHQIQTGEVLEAFRVVHSKHVCIVSCPIQRRVRWDVLAIEEDVAENACRKERNLAYNVQRVLQGKLPIVRLLHGASTVCFAKLTIGLKSQ